MISRFTTLRRIPSGVWVVGGVSLLMDVSSEMIHSLLPLFMATTLGASVVVIGLIEGLAEATALMVKVFSGVMSDWLGKRKGLALLGYGLGALSKPLFAIATTSGMILTARLTDRLGKGIRGARKLFIALAWLAAAIGVVFVFAIPRIYQLPTVTTWSSSWTTVVMLLTPLIGGGALAAALGVRRLGLIVSIVGIIASFCLRPGYLSTILLADAPLAAAQSDWFTAQAVLLAAGALGALVYMRARSGQALLFASAGVVIAAELIGRIAFYNLWTLPM